ncbi:MAG: arylesterase [Betaproteobacteria bacterium]|nr:arylesterase [Betaproteobacteria bacterium]
MAGVARATPGILVFGDSLSAAYGLAQARGWVALLGERLKRERLDYNVVNASISGETTRGGRSRLRQALEQHRPAVVIIELGGNDGLRGLPVTEIKENLAAMIDAAQQAGARVLLVGMRMPPNYGPDYTQAFGRVFPEVARRKRVALVPFIMKGIADRPDLFQDDRIHPTAEAQPILLDNVWAVLGPLLQRTKIPSGNAS